MPNFEKEAKPQVLLVLGPAIVGGILGSLMAFKDPPSLIVLCGGAYGSWLVIKMKIEQKKRTGQIISWGVKDMTQVEKNRYLFGYMLLGAALFYTILISK